MSWWKLKKGKALKPSRINPWRVPMNKPCKAFYGDNDGDGVMNMFDCAPHNKKKQGSEHEKREWNKEELLEEYKTLKKLPKSKLRDELIEDVKEAHKKKFTYED